MARLIGPRRSEAWLGVVLLVLSAMLVAVVAVLGFRTPADEAEGTVVDEVVNKGLTQAVVQFQDSDHREFEFISNTDAAVGDTVIVYFRGSDPAGTATTSEDVSKKWWDWLAVAAILGAVGVYSLYPNRRASKA